MSFGKSDANGVGGGAEKEGKRQSKREGEELEAAGAGGWNKAWLPSRDPALASEVGLSLVLHLDLPVLSFFFFF